MQTNKLKQKNGKLGEIFAMAHWRRVCKILRSEWKKKRRGHSPGNKFVVFYVNQPVCAGLWYDKTPKTV